MLMELAEDRLTPLPSSSFSLPTAAKMFFTPVCASSKLPRTAHTQTFSPACVAICACCTALTPP